MIKCIYCAKLHLLSVEICDIINCKKNCANYLQRSMVLSMQKNKNSQARIAANNRYNAKAYDRINIAVPKGKKDKIKAYAESCGESVNGFVNRAIDEAMKRNTESSEV